MALFKLSRLNFLRSSTSRNAPKVHRAKTIPAATGATVPPSVSIRPATLAELERRIEEEERLLAQSIKPVKPVKTANRRSPLKAMIGVGLLLGIPLGVIYLVNLPYAAIRRPVAATAPLLLLPSHISLDHHYRLAISTFEEAQQLISAATTPADLALGEQKLDQAQKSLDALPIDLVDSSLSTYGAYNWQFSRSRFNATRAEVGRLRAKVFQEKNAQNALLVAERSLTSAQQQYPQAKTTGDRQTAIALWQTALDQLQEIPGETLAGKTAQQNLLAYERDFEKTVGLFAGNERTLMVISSAKEYSQRAAIQGQDPPHSAEEWQAVMALWEAAITQVKSIPQEDLLGNHEAQALAAVYQQNLGQIRIRLAAETDSVRAFEQAQAQTTSLLASSTYATREATISQLQSIINQLNQVKPGTTVYLDAQADLRSAQNKLDQLKQ
ncbi:MAG: hypothetical protein WBB01_20470 [Phormidesmis sp.]